MAQSLPDKGDAISARTATEPFRKFTTDAGW
jgi:hypothetical protein